MVFIVFYYCLEFDKLIFFKICFIEKIINILIDVVIFILLICVLLYLMKSYFKNFKDLKIIFVFKEYDNVKNIMLK